MELNFKHPGLETSISIDETFHKNTLISITDGNGVSRSHYLTPRELNDFIDALKFVKKIKDKGIYPERTKSIQENIIAKHSTNNTI